MDRVCVLDLVLEETAVNKVQFDKFVEEQLARILHAATKGS